MKSIYWIQLMIAVFVLLIFISIFVTPWAVLLGPVAIGCGLKAIAVQQKEFHPQPELIDGRTHGEWYELIKMMGRDEYERLSRPALDGLEDSSEGFGGWNLKATLGDELYNHLMKEWYPEQYCKCGTRNCTKSHKMECSACGSTEGHHYDCIYFIPKRKAIEKKSEPAKNFVKCNKCFLVYNPWETFHWHQAYEPARKIEVDEFDNWQKHMNQVKKKIELNEKKFHELSMK